MDSSWMGPVRGFWAVQFIELLYPSPEFDTRGAGRLKGRLHFFQKLLIRA